MTLSGCAQKNFARISSFWSSVSSAAGIIDRSSIVSVAPSM